MKKHIGRFQQINILRYDIKGKENSVSIRSVVTGFQRVIAREGVYLTLAVISLAADVIRFDLHGSMLNIHVPEAMFDFFLDFLSLANG